MSFSAQQSSDGPNLAGCIGLVHALRFVGGGETPPLGARSNFRFWPLFGDWDGSRRFPRFFAFFGSPAFRGSRSIFDPFVIGEHCGLLPHSAHSLVRPVVSQLCWHGR